jgi:hypothetical protein
MVVWTVKGEVQREGGHPFSVKRVGSNTLFDQGENITFFGGHFGSFGISSAVFVFGRQQSCLPKALNALFDPPNFFEKAFYDTFDS